MADGGDRMTGRQEPPTNNKRGHMSESEISFADMLEESLAGQQMRPGSLLTGRVVEIGPDFVMVSAGLKSDSAIPAGQFRDDRGALTVAVGDEVEVALDAVEDGFGETRLSREKAKRAQAWRRLENAFESSDNVSGVISGKVKGGFTVDIDDIRAFLPGSLVDVRPVRDTSYLEGKPLEFKVIKLDARRNNVVVSRRAVVEIENSAEREALLERLDEGAVMNGVVKNLTDYGAFVDLGGIDGLLHITDMAWRRVRHPTEVVNVGDEIEVKVLKYDRERNRVSLGLKQLGEDPWVSIAQRYPEGSRIAGRVTNIADFGAFVEIEEGVEGLVHVSEMDWTNRNIHPSRVVQIGDEAQVMILDVDEDRRRISLGIKQCLPNPWEEFALTHAKADRVVGRIKSITDFGMFIGLDGGIDGLVHVSDLSWNEDGETLLRNHRKGEEIETVVLAVDAERERISLGIKQLDRDPFSAWLNQHPRGSVVAARVADVEQRGARVELAEGVEGYIRASEISRERVEDARTALRAGETVEVKVIAVDRRRRGVSLSIRERENDEEATAMEQYAANVEDAPATIGDLVKEQMDRR